jgi:homoserine kinase
VTPVTIRVPASSANLGPGFDALGLALATHLEFVLGGEPGDETHLALRTFRAAGGQGEASVRAHFAGGRGLGFSGAARLAGELAARLEAAIEPPDALLGAFAAAAELEGHPDNVAASAFGGLVVAAGGSVVRVELPFPCTTVVWVPERETSTRSSRAQLPETVSFADAVHNIGRTALLVAALGAGRVDALRAATADRLHQDRRFERSPESRGALDAMLEAGAWCGWLSGSGPSVAALCSPDDATTVAAAAPPAGRARQLAIDTRGAQIEWS